MTVENLAQLEQLWSTLLGSIEVKLSRATYETLISTTRPKDLGEGVFTLSVQSNFYRNYISERCQEIIEGALRDLMNDPSLRIHIDVEALPDAETSPPLPEAKVVHIGKQASRIFLNPRYTFKNFVVGQGNRFAHAASVAVAESPGHSYNPLFLYGGVGLGKTHLMQAIAHEALQRNPEMRVAYVTSEKFTNELINSIRDDKTEEFRRLYRHIDLLMVDDIQFLAGKERTQEEFFHTFNTLYEASRQIVISSDRPPRDIPTLEERLRSRFECGLIADIQPPDFETRIAILKKKAEIAELSVSDGVLALIAERIHTNIRELEGALIRLVAFASLNECDITIEVAESVLRDILGSTAERKGLSIDLVKKVAAEYYSIKIDDMDAKIRTKEIATARQVAMYLVRTLTSASLPKIGDEFGGRDHTTVIHAYEKIKSSLKTDPDIKDAVESITTNLKRYA